MEIDVNRLLNLLEDDDQEFEYICETILNTKHSDTTSRLVIKNKLTGEFFGVDYTRNYNWGLQDQYGMELYPMKAVQKTVYVKQ